MNKPRKPSKKKQARPRSREEGAVRIGRYMRWLYGADTPPATLAEPVIDAAFDEIAAVADGPARRKLLQKTMNRAYEGLGAS